MLNELKAVAQSLIDQTMVFEMHCRQTESIRSTALYQTVRVKLNLYPLIDFEAILLLLLYSADCAFSDKDSSFYIRCHVEVHLLTLYVIDLFRGFIHFHFPRNIPRIFDKTMICKWNTYF